MLLITGKQRTRFFKTFFLPQSKDEKEDKQKTKSWLGGFDNLLIKNQFQH